jgi:hypothetical protein
VPIMPIRPAGGLPKMLAMRSHQPPLKDGKSLRGRCTYHPSLPGRCFLVVTAAWVNAYARNARPPRHAGLIVSWLRPRLEG